MQVMIQIHIQILIRIQIQISRGSFWNISSPSAQSGPRKHPEGRFGAFQAPARKVVPGSTQRDVLEHFKPQRAKSSQEASRGSFLSISNASSQSGPRKHPEGRFGAFQAPARKVSGRRRAQGSPADVTRGTSAKQHSPGVENLRMRSEKHKSLRMKS